MHKITPILFLLTSFAMSAQTFSWLQSPTVDNDVNNGSSSYAVTTDSFGNAYMAGYKDMPYFYSDLLGRVQYNKYNSQGEIQYSKSIGGRVAIYDLKADSEGNLIMIAGYNQSIVFDTFAILSSVQGMKFIVLKFNPQGSLLWHVIIDPDDTTFINDMSALTLDGNDNIYVGYSDFMDSWITKLLPNGTTGFTIKQEDVNTITSLSIDNAGNIYSAGSCASNDAKFAGVTAPTTFNYNTYITKYTSNGIYQWVRYVDDITCSSPQVSAFSPDAVYFSSALFGNFSFDSITAEGPSQNFDDFFLTKLNSNGNFQWVREVVGEGRVTTGHRNFLGLDAIGNIYFAGATAGTINWNNNCTTSSIGFNNREAFILKYNPDGEIQMAKTVQNNGYDIFDGVSVNAEGDIYLSGLIGGGTANFDNIQLTVPQYDYYPVIAKLNQVALGTQESSVKNVIIYPNPSSDFISIENIDFAKGTMINSLGQEIMDFEAKPNQPIAISQLAKGTYIIRLEGHKPMKFIKS